MKKKKIQSLALDQSEGNGKQQILDHSKEIEKKADFSEKKENSGQTLHLQDKAQNGTLGSSVSTPIPNKKWFAFIEFVRKKDQKLAALVEVLSPKLENSNTVTFLFPEKMAFLKGLTEPKTHQFLENLLTDFMKSKKRFKIQFQNSRETLSSLGEQKQDDEAKALMEQAVASPFVQTVNKVFKGKIKNILKMEKDK